MQEISQTELGRIHQHLQKLKPKRRGVPRPLHLALRRQAMYRFGNSKMDSVTFDLLCDTVENASESLWREKSLAAWAMGRADLNEAQGKRAVEALSTLADFKSHGQLMRFGMSGGRALGRMIRFAVKSLGVLLFCGILSWLGILLTGAEGSPLGNLFHFLVVFCWIAAALTLVAAVIGVPLILPASFITDADHALEMRGEATQALVRIGRVEAVPALLRTAKTNFLFFSRGGKAALKVCLPLLTEDHASRMDRDAVPNLCTLLHEEAHRSSYHHDAEWMFALCFALEKIGDGRALPVVEKLMLQNKIPALTQRLLYLKPLLEERARRQTAQSTLLRGSEAPLRLETLLRPVTSAAPTEPQQLLRPSSSDSPS